MVDEQKTPQFQEKWFEHKYTAVVDGEFEKDDKGEVKKDATGNPVQKKMDVSFKYTTGISNGNKVTRMKDFIVHPNGAPQPTVQPTGQQPLNTKVSVSATPRQEPGNTGANDEAVRKLEAEAKTVAASGSQTA
jgi:hypothetical protein